MKEKIIVARILHMVETKDPMFMMLDDGILTDLYKENYFFGFPDDDSMDNVYLTSKGKEFKEDIEQALNKSDTNNSLP